ncbi:MAG TPA: metal-dependent hydrolase [Thermomicrobiales bacterium]|nr:metal-dependent hydrolase [Thermomicrobiales bacterium]
MKRTTHLMMGAAAGLLVAAPSPLPVEIGAVWLGVAGGGFPDWLDLRSELRGPLRLRHRGISHSLLFALFATALVGLPLRAVADAVDLPGGMALSPETALVWTLAFAAGLLTHLAGDACTHAGIRPLLPVSRWKMWLLPKLLRSRSDGYLNAVAMLVSVGAIGLSLLWRIGNQIGAL